MSNNYLELAKKAIIVVEGDPAETDEIESELKRLKELKSFPPATKTEREIIRLLTEIINLIKEKEETKKIEEKIENLEDKYNFSVYFD